MTPLNNPRRCRTRWLGPLLFVAACSSGDGQSGTDAQDVDQTDDTPSPSDSGGGGGASAAGGSAGMASGGSGGTREGGGSGAAQGGNGGSPGSVCPESPPENGAPCEEPWTSSSGAGLAYAHCSWGNDPRPQCRILATCAAQTWTITTPTDARCDSPSLGPDCPETPPTMGAECSDALFDCWYPESSHCFCSPCEGGSEYPVCLEIDPPQWACREPQAGCPAIIPQAGSVCEQDDAFCGPNCELAITCEDGIWQWNQGVCPICAAPNTLIATPSGEQEIAALQLGDLVYSVNQGAIEAVPVVRLGSTPVRHHQVTRVVLDSGASLEISPGHPTADGRRFADLEPNQFLDSQHRVVALELVPYSYSHTHDILPASDTGTYFASGALIGSTLFSVNGEMLEGRGKGQHDEAAASSTPLTGAP